MSESDEWGGKRKKSWRRESLCAVEKWEGDFERRQPGMNLDENGGFQIGYKLHCGTSGLNLLNKMHCDAAIREVPNNFV